MLPHRTHFAGAQSAVAANASTSLSNSAATAACSTVIVLSAVFSCARNAAPTARCHPVSHQHHKVYVSTRGRYIAATRGTYVQGLRGADSPRCCPVVAANGEHDVDDAAEARGRDNVLRGLCDGRHAPR